MTNLIKLLFFSTIILLSACPKRQPPAPAFNLPGQKTTIAKVQISPTAFAGARIVVLGFVSDVVKAENEDEDNILIISDSYGNTMNVSFEDIDPLYRNDTVLVNGKYRNSENLIVSENIIKVIVDKDGIRPYNDLQK